MLSIRFDREREWWVSGAVFERLFRRAIERGELDPALDEWQHIADANGGFTLVDVEAPVARALTTGLRAAAIAELDRLIPARESADAAYKSSLETLVQLLDGK